MDRQADWNQLAEKVKEGTAYDSPDQRFQDLFTIGNGLRWIWVARDSNSALWVFPKPPNWREWSPDVGYWWMEQSDSDPFRSFELEGSMFPALKRGEMFQIIANKCQSSGSDKAFDFDDFRRMCGGDVVTAMALAEIDSEVT